MELWELVAREQIRESIARYAHYGDRLLVEQMVNLFCPDGVLEITKDKRSYVGHQELFVRLGGGRPSVRDDSAVARVIRRHNIASIHFESMSASDARVASYFTVFTDRGLDHFGRYRDTFVPANGTWLIKHRLVARDWTARPGDVAS